MINRLREVMNKGCLLPGTAEQPEWAHAWVEEGFVGIEVMSAEEYAKP
jgi:hypothetical protein